MEKNKIINVFVNSDQILWTNEDKSSYLIKINDKQTFFINGKFVKENKKGYNVGIIESWEYTLNSSYYDQDKKDFNKSSKKVLGNFIINLFSPILAVKFEKDFYKAIDNLIKEK